MPLLAGSTIRQAPVLQHKPVPREYSVGLFQPCKQSQLLVSLLEAAQHSSSCIPHQNLQLQVYRGVLIYPGTELPSKLLSPHNGAGQNRCSFFLSVITAGKFATDYKGRTCFPPTGLLEKQIVSVALGDSKSRKQDVREHTEPKLRVGKDFCWPCSPTPLQRTGTRQLDQVAQSLIQPHSESLQGRGTNHIPVQPVQVAQHPLCSATAPTPAGARAAPCANPGPGRRVGPRAAAAVGGPDPSPRLPRPRHAARPAARTAPGRHRRGGHGQPRAMVSGQRAGRPPLRGRGRGRKAKAAAAALEEGGGRGGRKERSREVRLMSTAGSSAGRRRLTGVLGEGKAAARRAWPCRNPALHAWPPLVPLRLHSPRGASSQPARAGAVPPLPKAGGTAPLRGRRC